jgi:hypothetical protein
MRYFLVIVLLLCSVATAADPSKLTVENYNKVTIGSDIKAVYSCLGKETIADSDYGGGDKTLVWKSGKKKVSVSFQKNKVSIKWQSGLLD